MKPRLTERGWTAIAIDQLSHPAIVRWIEGGSAGFIVRTGKVGVQLAPTDAATQLTDLKKQLAELDKTLEKLEAVNAPAALPAEEKKPEESLSKNEFEYYTRHRAAISVQEFVQKQRSTKRHSAS